LVVEIIDSLLVTGGRIWTGKNKFHCCDSFLVQGDRFEAVGSMEEVLSHPLAKGSLKLDLEGRTVIPGITDSHVHLGGALSQEEGLDLGTASSLAEMLGMIKRKALSLLPDEWVLGYNFDETLWSEMRMPTRQDLDYLEIPNPVILRRTCIHFYVANSRAIFLGFKYGEDVIGLEMQDSNSGIFCENEAEQILRAYSSTVSGKDNLKLAYAYAKKYSVLVSPRSILVI